MMRAACAPLLVLILGTALPVDAAPVPPPTAVPRVRLSTERVLRSMLAAPTLIDYEGTKIISTMKGGRMVTVTVLEAHKRPAKTRLEFLSPDRVAGRLIVDNGAELWHYEPSLHMAFQGPTLAASGGVDAQVRGLLSAYDVELAGVEEVIGRSAFVVTLRSKGADLRRLVWVDSDTGIPLRVEERSRGETTYVTYFTRVSFSLNLPEGLFRFRAPAGARTFSVFPEEDGGMSVAEVERAVGFRMLTPTAAATRSLRFQRAAVVRYGSVTAAHLRYSDGGTSVSVFQVPARRIGRMPEGGTLVQRAGRTFQVFDLGYFKLITWEEGRLRLTVLGSLPLPDLIGFAEQFLRR